MSMILDVSKNPQLSRYEYTADGLIAVVDYVRRGDAIVLMHVGVPSRLEGRGIGSALVKFALDDIRREGLKVIAQCPFVATYIDRHPVYQNMLA